MNTLAIGCFLVAAAVALGAFGAHALGTADPNAARLWAVASEYHFIAAVGVIVHGLVRNARPTSTRPALLLLGGLCLFSGSLYALALGAPRWLGAVTPVGGLALMAGWGWLGVAALRR